MAHNPYWDGNIQKTVKSTGWNKLQQIIKKRDVTGAVKHLVDAFRRRLDPEWRQRMRGYASKHRVDRDFDRRYGVNTWGDIQLEQLGIAQQDIERGNGLYRPIDETLFWEAMSLLEIDHAEFNFVDYGSGKGKVLVMASNLPLRSIIGVEFSQVLHEVAVANLRNFHSTDRRCGEMSALCGDAIDYCPPSGPLLCFFCNPFSPEVWAKVLDKLRSSWEAEPRTLYVVYTNMRTVEELGTVLSDCDFLEPYAQRQRVVVYRAREMAYI